MPTSWAPEVFVEGERSRDALRFATGREPGDYAQNLFVRWTAIEGHRATGADEPANLRHEGGEGLGIGVGPR